MSNTFKGTTLAIATPVLWGIMSIYVRQLSGLGVDSLASTFLRCILAGAVYIAVIVIGKASKLKISLKAIAICALYGIIAYGIGFTAYNIAVLRISVAVATVIMGTTPAWVILLNLLVFKERPKAIQIAAVALCLAGIVLVSGILQMEDIKMDFVGILASLTNSLTMALQLVIPRKFEGYCSKDAFVAYGFLTASVVLIPFVDFNVFGGIAASGHCGSFIFNAVMLGVMCTFVANGAFVKAANYIDSTNVSLYAVLEVVVGIMVGCIVYDELLSSVQVAGAIIIVIGATMSNVSDLRSRNAL